MMGVYIKGMEMPADCHNCPIGFGGGCYFGTSADEYMCPDHGRAEWCPLVPVPPHGRLGDLDSLEIKMRNRKYKYGRESDPDCLVVDAPTIIPADGEEGT